MPLHAHWAPTLEDLADVAGAILRVPPPVDPFAPDVFVVAGRGVEQWFRAAFVERLDVVANLKFWSPSRMASELERWAVQSAGPTLTRTTLAIADAVARDPSLLPPELCHLADVRTDAETAGAGGSTADNRDAQRLAWSGRMARTYERYALYRREMLLAWERGATAGAGADASAEWQARLWRKAVVSASTGAAPAELQLRTLAALDGRHTSHGNSLVSPGTKWPRWLILQQGRLAPWHLELLQALSRHHEVHLLVQAPTAAQRRLVIHAAENSGYAEQVANAAEHSAPVTVRLGRARTAALVQTRLALADATHHLVSSGAEPHTLAHHAAQFASTEPALSFPSVLSALQHHLREVPANDPSVSDADTSALSPTHAISATDPSCRVLACHGPLRQVETLKDAILALLDRAARTPGVRALEPRDILILTPDPTQYVPLLQAVFPIDHGGAHSAPGLPLLVQGSTPRALNPVADLVVRLLALVDERVTASAVLDLVERGPVATRLGIAPDDAPLLRDMMHEAGVRWGLDADDPERAALGLTTEGTWTRGLTRVLLGVAMLGDNTSDVHAFGYAPVSGMEGERTLLTGRVARALRLLLTAIHAWRTPATLGEWQRRVQQLLEQVVSTDGPDGSGATRVRELLLALAADSDASSAVSVWSAAALAQLLATRLEEAVVPPGRVGGITVAPLEPGWMRPARVIALLGMDDDAYPRRGSTPWFDLLAENPQPGDPDERGEQLQVVFDAVLNARDALLISYTGWNRAGTMRLPPCTPVAALADAVCSVAGPDAWAAPVHVEMPLQPFSARAFPPLEQQARGVMPSYDVLAASTARSLTHNPLPSDGPDTTTPSASAPSARGTSRGPVFLVPTARTLPLGSLLQFLRNPAQEVLTRLRVALVRDARLLDNTHVVTLDRLHESAVVRRLATARLLHESDAEVFASLRHQDLLPPARLGDAWALRGQERAATLVAKARKAIDDTPRAAPEVLHVAVGDVRVVGTIAERHGESLLFLHDSKCRHPHLLGALATLAFACAGGAHLTRAVVVHSDACTTLTTPSDPMALLHVLVSEYERAREETPPYAPNTSWAYVEAVNGADVSHEEALDKARIAWDPEEPDKEGESSEPANILLHHVPPYERDRFVEVATSFFAPLVAAMEQS